MSDRICKTHLDDAKVGDRLVVHAHVWGSAQYSIAEVVRITKAMVITKGVGGEWRFWKAHGGGVGNARQVVFGDRAERGLAIAMRTKKQFYVERALRRNPVTEMNMSQLERLSKLLAQFAEENSDEQSQ